MALITKQQLEQASIDANYLNRFRVGPSDETIPTEEGLKPTIAGIVKQALSASSIDTMDGFTFDTGATIVYNNQALLYEEAEIYYRWSGAIPSNGVVVPPDSTPSTAGGIGPGKWLATGDGALKSSLATAEGAELVSFSENLTNELVSSLNIFLEPSYWVRRWGVEGSGNDESAAITSAINAVPAGSRLLLEPNKTYIFNNVVISKSVEIYGQGHSQNGSRIVTSNATSSAFKATSINNFSIRNCYIGTNVNKTGGALLDFTTCHRFTISDCFMDDYFLGISFNGGTEINIERVEGFTTRNGSGSGFAWFGKNNYTGSINVVGCYFKVDDSVTTLPEFGLRFGYVDVAYVDGSTTLIRHGHDIEVVPNGDGQFAHLVKIVGGILDTATCGIYVQPVNGANAEVELVGCYSAAMASAAWVFDGTNGKVVATLTGGQIFNCGVSGLFMTGANCTVIANGLRFSNNQIGFNLVNGATFYGDTCLFGDFDHTSGNQYPFAIDSTSKGVLKNSIFRNNINAGNNASANFEMYDNVGIDNWNAYTPTVTAISGALTAYNVASARWQKLNKNTVCLELAITVTTNGTGANGLVVTLPKTARTHSFGVGRAVNTSGKMLQGSSAPGDNVVVIRNYDGSYPAVNGELITLSMLYETNV